MLLDPQGHLVDLELLDDAWCGDRGLQVMSTRGAGVEDVVVESPIDLFGRDRGAFVFGMSGLPADAASVLALGRRWLGWLDDVGGRGPGRGRGILARGRELLLQPGDGGLKGIELR